MHQCGHPGIRPRILLTGHDQRWRTDELQLISAPTLIMTGEEDPGSNPRMAALMHSRIPDSKMEILPGLRHSLLVEAPELVAEKLNGFFLEESD